MKVNSNAKNLVNKYMNSKANINMSAKARKRKRD